MITCNEATSTSEKSVYTKPMLVTLNNQDTAGGGPSMTQEASPTGQNPNRKMQSLGPPPS